MSGDITFPQGTFYILVDMFEYARYYDLRTSLQVHQEAFERASLQRHLKRDE